MKPYYREMISQRMSPEYRRRFINELEIKLNALKCTPYMGIRKIDDKLDEEIKRIKILIAELRAPLAELDKMYDRIKREGI